MRDEIEQALRGHDAEYIELRLEQLRGDDCRAATLGSNDASDRRHVEPLRPSAAGDSGEMLEPSASGDSGGMLRVMRANKADSIGGAV